MAACCGSSFGSRDAAFGAGSASGIHRATVVGWHRNRVPRTRQRVGQGATEARCAGRSPARRPPGTSPGARSPERRRSASGSSRQPVLRAPARRWRRADRAGSRGARCTRPISATTCRVVVGEAGDVAAQRVEVAAVERLHPLEVARRADVHRIGDGGESRGEARSGPDPQIGGHGIVDVGGGHELRPPAARCAWR